ncbi:MAG: hypothetical protein N3E37_03385 [Candidatus Micrarchaeota archaeon]|nr:hypothetical protein [Candidatus Micrarchaeota archaeon]
MLELSTLAVSISILLSGISLGIGVAFSNKQLMDFGKEELFQAIINAAIIGVFVFLLNFLHSFTVICPSNVQGLELKENHTTIKASNCSIEKVSNYVSNITLIANSIYYEIAQISSLNVNIDHISINPFEGLVLGLQSIETKVRNISNMHSFIIFFRQISSSLLISVIDLLLMIGIIFRLFFPTRIFGNFLIALSFSISIVVPSTIEYFSSLILDDLVMYSNEINELSNNLLLLPKLHLGDQAVIEQLANDSAKIRFITEDLMILLINVESLLYFSSYLLLVVSVSLTVIMTLSMYKGITLIRLTENFFR